ncbi:MAG TPA: hypothetical protein VHS56_05435, partial [Candidatus Cybelea sp.]|nr:hypothetical protein [Candidatus Cybelea sp.]
KTAISSARLYWENKLDFFDVKGVTVPTGVSAFPHEIYTAPLSWSQKAYPKLVFYKKHDVGGHLRLGSSRSSSPKTFARRFARYAAAPPNGRSFYGHILLRHLVSMA